MCIPPRNNLAWDLMRGAGCGKQVVDLPYSSSKYCGSGLGATVLVPVRGNAATGDTTIGSEAWRVSFFKNSLLYEPGDNTCSTCTHKSLQDNVHTTVQVLSDQYVAPRFAIPHQTVFLYVWSLLWHCTNQSDETTAGLCLVKKTNNKNLAKEFMQKRFCCL